MDFEINKTKLKHKRWGEGILKSIDGNALVIEFPEAGVKKIAESSIENGILTVVDTESLLPKIQDNTSIKTAGSLVQYDKSDNVIGGKNIVEAFDSGDTIIFNESYTIVGDETRASRISATYDLTIIGNLFVDEIKVNGELIVIGNVTANHLNCANAFVCQGDVKVNTMYVGSIVAKSVKCTNFVCDGNALVETTIDIDQSSRTEKTMVACEGILGAGEFIANNAIANEYFEFDGDVQGKVVELDSNKAISEGLVQEKQKARTNTLDIPIVELIEKVANQLKTEFEKCSEMDEDSVLGMLESIENNSLNKLSECSPLFEKLIKLSYQDEIFDFGDYLYVVYAKKILPKEVYQYETIEHIDTILLPNAEKRLGEIEFLPKSVDNIASCIRIVISCADLIPISSEDAFEKIFSSFGIHYSTVKNILNKSSKSTLYGEKAVGGESNNVEVTDASNYDSKDMFEVENPKHKRFKASKEKFLRLSIQSEASYFGITDDERMRLSSAKIKTCGDFLKMTEREIYEIFKKKAFLANHLLQSQQKMRDTYEELTDE